MMKAGNNEVRGSNRGLVKRFKRNFDNNSQIIDDKTRNWQYYV